MNLYSHQKHPRLPVPLLRSHYVTAGLATVNCLFESQTPRVPKYSCSDSKHCCQPECHPLEVCSVQPEQPSSESRHEATGFQRTQTKLLKRPPQSLSHLGWAGSNHTSPPTEIKVGNAMALQELSPYESCL